MSDLAGTLGWILFVLWTLSTWLVARWLLRRFERRAIARVEARRLERQRIEDELDERARQDLLAMLADEGRDARDPRPDSA